jgi:hypothetical protein
MTKRSDPTIMKCKSGPLKASDFENDIPAPSDRAEKYSGDPPGTALLAELLKKKEGK